MLKADSDRLMRFQSAWRMPSSSLLLLLRTRRAFSDCSFFLHPSGFAVDSSGRNGLDLEGSVLFFQWWHNASSELSTIAASGVESSGEWMLLQPSHRIVSEEDVFGSSPQAGPRFASMHRSFSRMEFSFVVDHHVTHAAQIFGLLLAKVHARQYAAVHEHDVVGRHAQGVRRVFQIAPIFFGEPLQVFQAGLEFLSTFQPGSMGAYGVHFVVSTHGVCAKLPRQSHCTHRIWSFGHEIAEEEHDVLLFAVVAGVQQIFHFSRTAVHVAHHQQPPGVHAHQLRVYGHVSPVVLFVFLRHGHAVVLEIRRRASFQSFPVDVNVTSCLHTNPLHKNTSCSLAPNFTVQGWRCGWIATTTCTIEA